MMHEAEARARSEGHPAMTLTVHPENVRAVKFYEQLAWERCLTSDGRWTGEMEKRIT